MSVFYIFKVYYSVIYSAIHLHRTLYWQMPTQDSEQWNAYTGLYAVIHLHITLYCHPPTRDSSYRRLCWSGYIPSTDRLLRRPWRSAGGHHQTVEYTFESFYFKRRSDGTRVKMSNKIIEMSIRVHVLWYDYHLWSFFVRASTAKETPHSRTNSTKFE